VDTCLLREEVVVFYAGGQSFRHRLGKKPAGSGDPFGRSADELCPVYCWHWRSRFRGHVGSRLEGQDGLDHLAPPNGPLPGDWTDRPPLEPEPRGVGRDAPDQAPVLGGHDDAGVAPLPRFRDQAPASVVRPRQHLFVGIGARRRTVAISCQSHSPVLEPPVVIRPVPEFVGGPVGVLLFVFVLLGLSQVEVDGPLEGRGTQRSGGILERRQ